MRSREYQDPRRDHPVSLRAMGLRSEGLGEDHVSQVPPRDGSGGPLAGGPPKRLGDQGEAGRSRAYLASKLPHARTRNRIRQALVGFGDYLVDQGSLNERRACASPRIPFHAEEG